MTAPHRSTIHILGLGAMGTVLAVDLLRFTNALVVPLFRSQERLAQFKKANGNKISIRKLYLEGSPIFSYPVEKSECPETFSKRPIDNLVVTTKTYQTKEALAPYLPYINENTNLILIQNGLGVLELLKEEIFTDSKNRPHLFQGVISHGVYQDKAGVFNHAGWAGMKIARLPWTDEEMIQKKSEVKEDAANNSLVKLLTEPSFAKEFGIEHSTYQEMLFGQLFKFLVNACMNPVTAILDCVNGEMKDSCGPVFTSIIDECLQILRVAYRPLFQYHEKYSGNEEYPEMDVNAVLTTDNMVSEVTRIGCEINSKNSSSMRQDTLFLRDIEIEYINGYVVKLANNLNLDPNCCKVNKTIGELATLRLALNRSRRINGDWRKD
ncbi:2-dehydropantoate 2-reductase PAN5 [Saccharomyces paradoxus]|uniref:2-dehydropantoate 2-reductase n=1 Tax=Saccharomyces paradoxus TaxID=27291 RepID=A0A8B8USI4_SACPA|nr:Pan5 [Saccharomyces paradoxus]QHS73700.1 Pan5 [Saccharomyces paradoxus]